MSARVLGVPVCFLVAVGIAAVVHVVISSTALGATIRGLGSNQRAAEYLGIRVHRLTVLIYAVSGVLAGIAAFVALGLGGSLSPSDYVGIELQAIAVSVIGGARFKGGVGSIPGTLIAAVFVGVVLNGLIHLGLPSSYLKLSNGTLLVLAVIVDSLRRRGDLDE
jgi:ribose transport system permease protein